MVRRSPIWASEPEQPASLGQERIAEFLAEDLLRDPDLHLAVSGPWGSGKTRILKLVKREIETRSGERDRPDPIMCWYDPWRYSPDQNTLRRTFLFTLHEAAEDAGVEDLPELDKLTFYSDQEKEVQASEEVMQTRRKQEVRSFWISLGVRTKILFSAFLILAIVLAALPFLQPFFPPSGSLLRPVGVLTAGAFFATCYDVIDRAKDLKVDATATIVEPQVDRIDQFEASYKQLIGAIHDEGRDILVFVDDLDRCSDDEIRTVMTGLSTYLGPGDPGGSHPGLGFVVALDDARVVDAYDMDAADSSPQTENILLKTFHSIVPVPVPSNEEIRRVVRTTLEELDWRVRDAELEDLAKLSARHAEGNLRIIRSSLAEAHWLRRYAESVLLPGREEAEHADLQVIKDDPVALYQLALIRLKTDLPDLRGFLAEPAHWNNDVEAWPDPLPKELFLEAPAFSKEGLDPRPLLTLGQPSDLTHSLIREAQLRDLASKAGGDGPKDEFKEEVSIFDDETKIDLARVLQDTEPGKLNAGEKSRYSQSVLWILEAASGALSNREEPLFKKIWNRYATDGRINHDADPSPQRWLRVAASISDACVEEVISDGSPFMKEERSTTLQALRDLAKDGLIDPHRYLQEEVESLRGNKSMVKRSAGRIVEPLSEGLFEPSDQAREYLVKLLEAWDWSKAPGGPDIDLFDERIIASLGGSDQQARAEERWDFVAVSEKEAPKEFARALRHRGWPIDTSGADPRPEPDGEEED